MTRNFIVLTRDYVRTLAAAFAIVILLTQPAPALISAYRPAVANHVGN